VAHKTCIDICILSKQNKNLSIEKKTDKKFRELKLCETNDSFEGASKIDVIWINGLSSLYIKSRLCRKEVSFDVNT
jgi:hypothetical protein